MEQNTFFLQITGHIRLNIEDNTFFPKNNRSHKIKHRFKQNNFSFNQIIETAIKQFLAHRFLAQDLLQTEETYCQPLQL